MLQSSVALSSRSETEIHSFPPYSIAATIHASALLQAEALKPHASTLIPHTSILQFFTFVQSPYSEYTIECLYKQ